MPIADEPLPELLSWMCRVGPATAASAARRFGCSEASARARLQAAVRRGLARRIRPLAGRPSLYLPTARALRAAGLGGANEPTVSAASAEHALACAAVAAELARRYPGSTIAGELLLRLGERSGGGVNVRLGVDRFGRTLFHRPDLAVWRGSSCMCGDAREGDVALACRPGSLPVVVEVELTVKAPRRLREICLAWARSRAVDGVLYVVSPAVRAPLARAIAGAGAGERISIVELPDPDRAAFPRPSEASQARRSLVAGG